MGKLKNLLSPASPRSHPTLVGTAMLSTVRSSSRALRQALVVGGSRQSGLVAASRFQARSVQSVAQTDRVASPVPLSPSCKFSANTRLQKLCRRRLPDSYTRLEPSVKSNAICASFPRLPIPLSLQNSPSSKSEVPSSTSWMSWPSVSASCTALGSIPSSYTGEDLSST